MTSFDNIVAWLSNQRPSLSRIDHDTSFSLIGELIDFPLDIFTQSLENLSLNSAQITFLEKLCRQMDVRKKLYYFYDENFDKPMTTELLSLIHQSYALFLVIGIGLLLNDYKYVNSALKYHDIMNKTETTSFIKDLFDECILEFFYEKT